MVQSLATIVVRHVQLNSAVINRKCLVCFISLFNIPNPRFISFQYSTSLSGRVDRLETTIIVYIVMQILNIKTEGFLIENILK